jgi:hypothetical protein
VQIGTTESNDFTFDELRRQLFDDLGTVDAAIPLPEWASRRC